MASTITRRPLPALVSLLALLALTGIVWWRVVNRDDTDHASGKSTPTPAPTCNSSSQAPPTPGITPKSVTVQVLNSTDRAGIAGRARTALIADGFRSAGQAGNDSSTVDISQSAEIRYGASGAAGAQLLQYYFPGSKLTKVSSKSATVTVSLGDAYRGVASAASVRAAIAKAARPSGSAPSGSASSSATAPGC